MDKPWFKLNPNDEKDRWWLYTSIINVKTAAQNKKDDDILGHFIIEDKNYYRLSTWYKDDPNRYLSIVYNINWGFNTNFHKIKEGDIVTKKDFKFKAYDCIVKQNKKCIILERIFD